MKNICQKIADDLVKRTDLKGKGVRVTISLAALTRSTYDEEIIVPEELLEDPLAMDDLVARCYESVDGTEFADDHDYWERSDCCSYAVDDSAA